MVLNNKGLSFIIPALNEEMHIGGVLDAISENVDTRFQYEVIVVDNGSTDFTLNIAQRKGAICLKAPGCTISFLRNLGVNNARFNICVFLDADVYLAKAWGKRIGTVMERLQSKPHIITGSFCGISEENNWLERIWFAPRMNQKEINYINSGHLIIHNSLFMKVGGFDVELETGEDYEFCMRASQLGARIENDPALKVVHAGYPKSITTFFTRERWHGRGDYLSLKTLTSSKPALVSVANLCVAGTSVVCIPLFPQYWFVFSSAYLFFLAGVSLVASIHRCRGEINWDLFRVVFLYMIYFTARTVSLIDVFIGSIKARFF